MYKRIVRWISALLTLALLFQLTPLLPWGTLFRRAAASTVPAGEEGYTFDIPQASDNTTTAIIPDTFIDLTEAAAPGTANADSAAGFSSTATTASTNSTESTTITTDGELDPFPFHVSAPYLYDSGSNEKISLNSGALIYESTDYVLPGKNGLDLVIGRRYDSQNASAYAPKIQTTLVYFAQLYYVERTYRVRYYYPDSDTWVDGTGSSEPTTLGPYTSYTDAQAVAESNTYTTVTDSGDHQIYRYYTASVTFGPFTYQYRVTVDKAENDHFTGMYGLGDGWSFLFSSIEIDSYTNRTLHLSDGRSYSLNGNTANPSNIPDYVLDDMVLDHSITEFSNGSVTSYYRLSYQDGRREYFDQDGKLIGIQDRYDNTITLVHSTQNDYPHITIIDTVGRVITISGQATETGHAMTVALPDNVNLVYQVAHSGSTDGIEALSAYHDPVGQTTQYSYTIQEYSYSFTSKSALNTSVQAANLTTVTHPTLAQTVYTYELDQRNFGPEGLMGVYKATGRADQVGADTLNQLTYTYSSDDSSGYPTHEDPGNLPENFTYSTTVTDGQGKVTTAVFNNEHLTTAVTVSHGETTLQETLYQYSKDKLPIKTTARQYNSSGSYMETITAAEYDAKGNVTAQWSSYAGGDTDNTEHKTTYTYDSTYGLPLTQTYKTNSSTTVRVENTLDEEKRNIAATKVYVNDTLTCQTDYTYDPYGNITSQKQYHENLTDYALTEYTYQNGAYLSQEKYSGILAADGTAAQSTPGQEAGVIVTTHTYDALGRRTSTTDGSGNTTSYTYDAVGNVTCVTNPDDTTVTYLYDYAGNKVTVTDENGSRLTYTYTPLGLEFETIDTQTGSVISRREYDACSRLVTLSDFVYGGVTRYAYDILGRVTSETVYQDTTVLARILYAYDDGAEGGLYQKVTKTVVGSASALPVVTTQYTNKHGNVIKTGKVLNGTEYFDVNTYDYVGNLLTKLTAADGQKGLAFTARYVYNEANQVVTTYRADGETTTNTYNALGQLVQTTDFAGTPTTYTYDALGRLLTQTITIDTGVTATSKYDYDPAGNLIREYKPTNAVGETAHWARVEYSYDSRQRLTAVAQYEGETVAAVTRYIYDGAGNTLTMTCGLTSLEDDSGSTTAYTYDRFGNVLTTTDALGKTETNTYSSLGRLESTTDRGGVTTAYGYDALGRVLSATAGDSVTYYTYTRTGQLQSQWNNWQLTEYTYDEFGRVVTVEETRLTDPALVPEPEPEPEVEVTPGPYTITLNTAGGTLPEGADDQIILIAFETVALPTPTRIGYTFQGWYLGDTLITVCDTTIITKDCTLTAKWELNSELPEGYILITLDVSGGALPDGTDGEIVLKVGETAALPTPTLTGYTFDGWYLDDTLITDSSTASLTENCTLVTGWEANRYTICYNYGPGNFTQETQECAYDQDVTIRKISIPLVPGYPVLADCWHTKGSSAYYLMGSTVRNLTAEPNGVINLYAAYSGALSSLPTTEADLPSDENGVATASALTVEDSEETTTPAVGAETYTKTYTYDLAGNRTGFTLTLGGETLQSVTYTYDDLNRLSTVSEGGTVQAAYTYDTNGNRATLTYANGVVESYGYNKANWINALTNAKDGTTLSSYAYTYYTSGSQKSETDHTGIVTGYTYDDLGRLTQESETGGLTVDYTYDAGGNRARMAVSGTETYTVDYTYDANNRLTGENKVQNGVSTYTAHTYDHNGNLLSELDVSGAAVVSHTYDEFNRLISTVAGTATITYSYNADGIRTARSTSAGHLTEYLLDGGNVVGQVVDETTVTSYLRGVNLISDGTSYYLFNAHGDVVQLADSTGAVVKNYDYDAFGNEKNPDEEDTNPFRYCGEYYDTETGLYYLRARYYDPALGRFIAEDPIQYGENWYVYCSNNPIARIDPNGLRDYIYTSQENYYIEDDWGALDFFVPDRYFIEVDGVRYAMLSVETIELYKWDFAEGEIDTNFLNSTFDLLINQANEEETDIMRVLTESVGGELDFKKYLDTATLYLINGVLYNSNQAGNFVWAYFLESKNMSGYMSGILAQGGTFLPLLAQMNGMPRFDEWWDRHARWAGVKYYYTRINSEWKYYLLYPKHFRI